MLGRKTLKALRHITDKLLTQQDQSQSLDYLCDGFSSQKTPIRFPSLLSQFRFVYKLVTWCLLPTPYQSFSLDYCKFRNYCKYCDRMTIAVIKTRISNFLVIYRFYKIAIIASVERFAIINAHNISEFYNLLV